MRCKLCRALDRHDHITPSQSSAQPIAKIMHSNTEIWLEGPNREGRLSIPTGMYGNLDLVVRHNDSAGSAQIERDSPHMLRPGNWAWQGPGTTIVLSLREEATAPRYWNSRTPSRLIRAFFTAVVADRQPGPFHKYRMEDDVG